MSKTRLASMGDAEAKRKPKGGAKQDAPIYVDGKRELAPGKGVKDSDIPAQSPGTTHMDGKRRYDPLSHSCWERHHWMGNAIGRPCRG